MTSGICTFNDDYDDDDDDSQETHASAYVCGVFNSAAHAYERAHSSAMEFDLGRADLFALLSNTARAAYIFKLNAAKAAAAAAAADFANTRRSNRRKSSERKSASSSRSSLGRTISGNNAVASARALIYISIIFPQH